jgi:hypothetical protein
MFKTNSRKGFGLTAIVALVGSLLVGATPAQAANEVVISPKTGTTYAALAGEKFEIQVVAGSTIPSTSWGSLKFKVSNAANATFSATASAAVGGTTTSSDNVTASSVVVGAANTASGIAYVAIQAPSTAADIVFTVQAWLDADADGAIDAGEFVSDAVTLTFYKASNVTWTTTLTAPILGDTELVATVTSDKNINLAQADYDVQVGFATVSASLAYATVSAATTVSAAGAFTQGDAGTQNTAKTSTEVEVSHTVLAANTYVAQAVYNGAEIGSESIGTVGAAAVSNIDAPTLSKGVNVKGATVRTGTTDLSFTAVVSKSAGVAAADGTVVSIEISEGAVDGLATGATVTAGGKVLTNSVSSTVQKITFDVSVASGKVTVPVALSGLKAGNSITVKATNGNSSANTTVTIADTAAASIANLSTLGTNGIVKAAKGGSYSLVFGALDNFDQPLSGDYRVTLTNAGSVATVSQALSGGKATFAVTDNADKTEGEFTATLEKLNSATNNYANTNVTVATISPVIGTSNAATKVTVAAHSASNLVLNAETQSAADTRVGETAPKVTSGNAATLSGQVTDVNGLGTYAMVTLSAPDAMFVVDGVYSLGSVTVHTSATGAYSGVTVYRQLAGKVSVSAAVGSVTGDVGLTYLAATEAKASKITLTAPTGVKSGSTFQVKGKLTDKFGNPVKVSSSGILSVKYTGPGFVTATLPSTTDAAGEFMFSVLLGSSDVGAATVTVAYDGDADATTTTDNLAATATIMTGEVQAVNAVIGSFKGRWAVRIENGNGSTIAVKAGGKWYKYVALNDNYLFSRKSRVGASVGVSVYVNGSLENTETITIK